MTTTHHSPAPGGVAMDPMRRTAVIAGGLYLLTFASSIPARFYFLDPVLSDPGTSSARAPTRASSSAGCSTWSTPSPASPPRSCCSGW
jgi:hypothetical protein